MAFLPLGLEVYSYPYESYVRSSMSGNYIYICIYTRCPQNCIYRKFLLLCCWDLPRLLLSTILRCRPPFVVTFGLVCSSFVAVSRGSTHRHFFLPLGDETAPSVKLGNLLASRTDSNSKNNIAEASRTL